jgi:U-box domain
MAASIPDEFVCPISGDVMRDPVWLSTGIAVDRTYAEYYLQAGFRQCPVTGETIADTKLVPVGTCAAMLCCPQARCTRA